MKDLVDLMEEELIPNQELECPISDWCDFKKVSTISYCDTTYLDCCYYKKFGGEE